MPPPSPASPHSRVAPAHQRDAQQPNVRSVLLVGNAAQAEVLLTQTLNGHTRINRCADWFEAIAQAHRENFDAIIAPARPIERRAESAVKRLRDAAGESRLILLAEPANESLARRLLASGCDDYLIWPATGPELIASLTAAQTTPASPPPSLPTSPAAQPAPTPTRTVPEPSAPAPYVNGKHTSLPSPTTPPTPAPSPTPPHIEVDISHVIANARQRFALDSGQIAQVIVDALLRHPASAVKTTLDELNARLPGAVRLSIASLRKGDPVTPPHLKLLSRVIPLASHAPLSDLSSLGSSTRASSGLVLHVLLDKRYDDRAGQDLLDLLTPHFSRVLELQDRHLRLQRLAITDDLTGLCNARYFRHILEKIMLKAQEQRFPVTLLLFDIDHFKKYNDRFGHAAGDEILRQTARVMKECVREHDYVARLGGDEFAVIFWENDSKRQPYPGQAIRPGKPPSSPALIFERFRKLIQSHKFACLGPDAQGSLTISGGLAVYPYDARTPDELVAKADKALMFGAKTGGRNSLHIVGPENQSHPE